MSGPGSRGPGAAAARAPRTEGRRLPWNSLACVSEPADGFVFLCAASDDSAECWVCKRGRIITTFFSTQQLPSFCILESTVRKLLDNKPLEILPVHQSDLERAKSCAPGHVPLTYPCAEPRWRTPALQAALLTVRRGLLASQAT